ncbi:unnamed protein product [Polarella glacialis]|uniref:Uncharacterized protein n=1 Tax=Polarella glacialis TaxID=89957 RepID=A0A813E484_POLGL|nr:unnamed protein product [Polarella glacialis]
MIHKDLVGWMAIGIENLGGGHFGMNGVRVVMGLNNSATSPSIGEYKIDEALTAFRQWQTQLSPSAFMAAEMSLTKYFSSIHFKTNIIYGMPLNVTSGTSRLIWARARNAYVTVDLGGFAAYHSDVNGDPSQRARFRGHVRLDLASGLEIPTSASASASAGAPSNSLSVSRAASSQSRSGAFEFLAALAVLQAATSLQWLL